MYHLVSLGLRNHANIDAFFFLTTIAINSDSLFLMQESCVLRQYS